MLLPRTTRSVMRSTSLISSSANTDDAPLGAAPRVMDKANLPNPQLDVMQVAGLRFLTDERLFRTCGIRVAFTSRAGGVSVGDHGALNLGAHTEDDAEHIEANRSLVRNALGADDVAFIYPLQVHGDNVVCVNEPEEAACAQQQADEGADGILVRCADVAPLLCFADCVPVVLVSRSGFAVVHAGWRGVMARIAPKAARMLLEGDEALDATEINVYLGPHIGPECFETSFELHDEFIRSFGEGVSAGKRHIDLSRALMTSLEEIGIPAHRMIDAGLCTVCHNDEYFSYRAQDGRCGRHAALCFRKE